jgi:hypothetical protein
MHPSIRHYAIRVDRESADYRGPRVRALVLEPKPTLLDRVRASLRIGGREAYR